HERSRLRDIVRAIPPKEGGVIVRTAAEGASADDVRLDLEVLMKLWKQIQSRPKSAKPPSLIFQEAELPLRVRRAPFTGAVEKALQEELERDRTKTYVVEISPLGLVEMTRQNVTDGPREILTRKCPTCAGEGVVVSEATAVVDAERRLRALAASKPRTKAF